MIEQNDVRIIVEVVSTRTNKNLSQEKTSIKNFLMNPIQKIGNQLGQVKNIFISDDESSREITVPSEDNTFIPPHTFQIITKTSDSIYLSWFGNSGSYEGIISSGDWKYPFTVYTNYAMIDSLSENTRYEVAIRGVNGMTKTDWGMTKFTTESQSETQVIEEIADGFIQTDNQRQELFTVEPEPHNEGEGILHYLTVGDEVIEKYFTENDIKIGVEVLVPIRSNMTIKYSNQDSQYLWKSEIFINGRKVAKKGILIKNGNDVEVKAFVGKRFIKPIQSSLRNRTKGIVGIQTTGLFFQNLWRDKQELDSAEPIPITDIVDDGEYPDEVYQYTTDIFSNTKSKPTAKDFIKTGITSAENFVDKARDLKKKGRLGLFARKDG